MMYRHPARLIPYNELIQRLQIAVSERLVTERHSGNLRIYNYTPATVYDRRWDEITLVSRGLIVDAIQERVVATPFCKFFNLYERPDDAVPLLPFEVFEKLDGSLVIIFHDGSSWRTATRGSFESTQAKDAAAWLGRQDISLLVPGTTYLAEWVGPSNQIVVPYDKEELILLSAFDRDGFEWSGLLVEALARGLGWKSAKRFDFNNLIDLVDHASSLPAIEEGFVIRFINGHRLKVKGEQYKRVHALISRCTPLAMWEAMMNGDNMNVIREQLPDEFLGDYDAITGAIQNQINEIVSSVKEEADKVTTWSDKEVGLNLQNWSESIRQFIFPYRKNNGDLLSGRTRWALFRSIRPTGQILEGYTPSFAMNRALDEMTA